MKTHQREILIYYNPESSADRKTVAYAQSLAPHVRSYAFGKTPSTRYQLANDPQSRLIYTQKNLLNKAHPYYQKHIRGREFDEESWMNMFCVTMLILIKAPIAIREETGLVLCTTPTDIYRLIKQPVAHA